MTSADVSSVLRAYIASIEEMSVGVGLPALFLVVPPLTPRNALTTRLDDVHPVALPPDSAKSFYEAIAEKWRRDQAHLIRLYEGYARAAECGRALIARVHILPEEFDDVEVDIRVRIGDIRSLRRALGVPEHSEWERTGRGSP